MKKAFKNLSDNQLIEQFLQGSTLCFDTLIQRYRSKWLVLIHQIVKDKDLAEDLLQDAILKIYHAFAEKQYKEHQKFAYWAGRICKNIAIDYYRSANHSVPIEETTSKDISFANQLDKLIAHEKSQLLEHALRMLPPSQMQVIWLRFYEEMSFKEIAEVTQTSINTALGRARYALHNLKKILQKQQT